MVRFLGSFPGDRVATAVALENFTELQGKTESNEVCRRCALFLKLPDAKHRLCNKVVECFRAGVVFGTSLISASLQTESGSRRIIGRNSSIPGFACCKRGL